jgi:hypothetical protein
MKGKVNKSERWEKLRKEGKGNKERKKKIRVREGEIEQRKKGQ